MVFRRRCSSTNFFASAISSYVRGSRCPGKVLGAPGSSSMAWSHTVCLGSRCDSCSEKILACCWYWLGMSGFSSTAVSPMVALPIKYQFFTSGHGLLTVRGENLARFAFGAWSMMGSCDESIHPLFQSIFSCVATNHEYPRMALFSPRSVRKKRRGLLVVPVWTSRSV